VRTLGEDLLVRHELHLPLMYSGRPIGLVTLGSVTDAGFHDLDALWLMTDAAAVAVSNALALEAARHVAQDTRAVLETAHDAYIAVDGDLVITAWTPQAEALFGFSEQEALGERVDELVIPERWRAGYRAEHHKLLSSGATTGRFELPATAKDGRRLHVEVSVSPRRTGQGWQVNAFVRDIGERVARERAREVQRAVSQALAETSAHEDVVPRVLDAIGRTLRWPAAIHWVPDGGNGPRAAATWHDGAGGAAVEEALSDALRGEPPGRFIVPLSDTLGTFEFRQRRTGPLEPELMQALEDISTLVGEVLERRRIQVETDRLKNEFFALVSHELRTPLTSIIGYVELLLEEEAGEVPPDQMRFLGIIDRNARRLQRLVGDLLFVAQVEAGTLSLEKRDVDLEAVVADAVEAALPRAQQAGVELTAEIEPLPGFVGDPDRLAQIVDNLVTNAVKFTPEGGHVSVRALRRESTAVIEVSDTGIGIPASDVGQVFERFYRTQTATERSIPGIGLGLSIVQAIAVGHGGTVGVESEEGRGTTFTVELPISIHEVTQR
jgi:PAS domain S-box-containing protein